ncbi:MAG: CBS domain-containing protein [Thermoleophilaceae bacterium]|nr:CBS domain-containing protein [Thermoleophilaceae bacterium]
MLVSEGMSRVVLTVGPQQSLRDVARQMTDRRVGAAVVIDPDAPGPAIVTERDVLRAYAEDRITGDDPVSKHATERIVFASPDWSLEQAADEMVRGSFRHLVVIDAGSIVGILSMRDIVTSWAQDGATSEVPVQRTA